MARELTEAEKPRYVLYFRGHRPPDLYSRTWVPIYTDPHVAHAVLLRFIAGAEYTRDGNVLTITDTSLTITCEQLDNVLKASPSSCSDADARTCLRFKLGSWEEDHSKTEDVEVVTPDGEVVVAKKIKAKVEKPKRAVKPDNYVTISELCTQWKIKPLDARTALRASDLTKPEYGWAFDPKDVPKIAKLCGVKK